MNSKLASKRLRIDDSGIGEAKASEATFRAGLNGRFTVAHSNDPYNGAPAERQRPARRTDLRELSRLIQDRRNRDARDEAALIPLPGAASGTNSS